MRHKYLTLALAIAALPAFADDRPLIRPSRDVMVEYRMVGSANGAASEPGRMMTMRYTDNGNRIRVEGLSGHGYAIMDAGSGRMIMVMTEQRMYMERAGDPSMTPMFQAENARFEKTGTDSIAGLRCTSYAVTSEDRKGEACLTDDGVMLRARSGGADSQRGLEAVNVTYASQPAALFEPPAGFQKFDPANMPHGTNLGPPGGPRGSDLSGRPGR